MEDSEPDWTSPEYCPYCGSENLEDSEDWEMRDVDSKSDHETRIFRLHGINSCKDCGGEFETMSDEKENNRVHDLYTLQFVIEEEDGDTRTRALKIIEGGEDDFAVKSERVKWNMMYGWCGEVQGPEYAIRELYKELSNKNELPEEEEFEAGKWLADKMED